MNIRAVLFDMGETLIRYDYDSPSEVFGRILVSLGISTSMRQIEDAFASAQKEAEGLGLRSSFGKIGCDEYWNRWDSLVLKHAGIPNHAELGEIVQSKWFDFLSCAPYPEVRGVFAQLRRRELKVGLISAGYEVEIRHILQRAGLEDGLFDVMVGVDTVRKVKPDPDVFRYAVNALNVDAREALFVGDSVEMDYDGARAAGMKALLVRRRDTSAEDSSRAETIRSLKEIFRFID